MYSVEPTGELFDHAEICVRSFASAFLSKCVLRPLSLQYAKLHGTTRKKNHLFHAMLYSEQCVRRNVARRMFGFLSEKMIIDRKIGSFQSAVFICHEYTTILVRFYIYCRTTLSTSVHMAIG